MTTFTRAQWGARTPKATTPMVAAEVVGIAVHWPAMEKPLRGTDAIERAIRGWQNYHMDGHGWSDIAYQVAIDQDGNVYELRGLKTRSAANGDEDVNRHYGAILLILAPGEKPSAEMIAATRGQVEKHRALFPKSTKIVGHGQIRPEPTSCPGPAAQAAIDAGTFEPVASRPEVVSRIDKARDHLHAARELFDTAYDLRTGETQKAAIKTADSHARAALLAIAEVD
jgi:hypothetical protein